MQTQTEVASVLLHALAARSTTKPVNMPPSFISLLHHLPFLLLLLVLQILFQLVPGSPSPILHYSGATSVNHTAIPPAAAVPCLPDQESALLRLKRSFVSTSYSSFAFRSWRDGTDCCHWEGIECGEANGQVTTLDLGDCSLESSYLDPAVFELTSLRYLNLGGNDFNLSDPSSSRFERLTSLTYLNLSNSNFKGQVPDRIGRLANLVSLDISGTFEIVEIPNVGYKYKVPYFDRWLLTVQNFTALVANLGSLRELYLGAAVDLSHQTEWCDSLSKYTPNLRVLSLPSCRLHSPICGSLSALKSLSVIDLKFNGMVGPFPNFFANFSFLSVLQLSYNDLEGWVSPAIFEQKKLVTIDVHENHKLSGSLPNFSADSYLQHLLVGGTNFSGTIPSSIGKVKSLNELGLNAVGFSGNLPSSLGELKSLNILQISGLGLVGPIPSWTANLTSLVKLQFSRCGLYGQIPSSIGQLINLRQLIFAYCKASGEILPQITNITQLQVLVLASNNFTGTVELNSLRRLPNLNMLDLSNNEIIAIDGQDNSSEVSSPNILFLKLASCGITQFPSILRHLNEINGLDLSKNQIHGTVPQWALEKLTDLGLFFLNFPHNKFTNIGRDNILPFYAEVLDLSHNMFEGPIPIPQYSGGVLDYSNNMFSSFPLNISTQLWHTSIFKASRNNISGSIPEYMSNNGIEFLDLLQYP